MALRFLLNRGCAPAKHHRTTGLFLTSVSNKTNHQIHQKRDLILLSDGMDDQGICFSNSESPYTFESVSATIKDPYQHGEILDMAKFSVNEHNNNHAEGVEKRNNLRLEYVLEARLGFRWGITEFDITLSALDEGIVNGSSLDTVYKATVSKSRTGDLTLRQFNQFDLPEGMTASPRKKKNHEERILKKSEVSQ